ncbi:Notch ligand involved in the mediation of Notch signaling (By similarity) [Seminavis robusta]|uniref:Notch ligand involved in the mediation of Notch signaling By similarity n=1 Tax=Seminavis robusta TaxID=568900 RepID=A0A9N8DWM6_9STRA|nr:Notch ligand involved in the mediation of Notch signaling (By similarity) [Seminavis robusta]|eukprot:Sro328_g118590.1 Notch ligand involved in the mediation of Notch signaling (By similarity) (319) ;mRNA; f:24769-25986
MFLSKRKSTRRLPRVLSLLAVMILSHSQDAAGYTPYVFNCFEEGFDKCIHGTCNENTKRCECDAFYAGDDCSTPSYQCADGVTFCYNGGICIPDSTNTSKYNCDCFKHEGITLYKGDSCETPTYVSCERHSRGDFSYCINGGSCRAYVTQQQEHVPCDCSGAQRREGQGNEQGNAMWDEHCQFLGYMPFPTMQATTFNSGLSEIGILGIVMIVGGVIAFAAVLGLQIRRQKQSWDTQEAILVASQRNNTTESTEEEEEEVVSFEEADLEMPLPGSIPKFTHVKEGEEKQTDTTTTSSTTISTNYGIPKGQVGPEHTIT